MLPYRMAFTDVSVEDIARDASMQVRVRFLNFIEVDGDRGCWLWKGEVTKKGYARFYIGDKHIRAHRWAYLHFIGPIEEETTDHLCEVKRCVNPWHIEPCSIIENIRRYQRYWTFRDISLEDLMSDEWYIPFPEA